MSTPQVSKIGGPISQSGSQAGLLRPFDRDVCGSRQFNKTARGGSGKRLKRVHKYLGPGNFARSAGDGGYPPAPGCTRPGQWPNLPASTVAVSFSSDGSGYVGPDRRTFFRLPFRGPFSRLPHLPDGAAAFVSLTCANFRLFRHKQTSISAQNYRVPQDFWAIQER